MSQIYMIMDDECLVTNIFFEIINILTSSSIVQSNMKTKWFYIN
jgi:hypothetical protein